MDTAAAITVESAAVPRLVAPPRTTTSGTDPGEKPTINPVAPRCQDVIRGLDSTLDPGRDVTPKAAQSKQDDWSTLLDERHEDPHDERYRRCSLPHW